MSDYMSNASGINYGPSDEIINSQVDQGQKTYNKQRYGSPQFSFPNISQDSVDKDRLLSVLLGAGAGAHATADAANPFAALAMGLAGGIGAPQAGDMRAKRQMAQYQLQEQQNKLAEDQLNQTPLGQIAPQLAEKFNTDFGLKIGDMPLGHAKQFFPFIQTEVKNKEVLDKFQRDKSFREEVLHSSPSMQAYWESTFKMPPGTMATLKVAEEGNLKAALEANKKSNGGADKQWENLNRRTNPMVAPRGSLLGQAGVGNARADRALTILNGKSITPQEVTAVVNDFAGIMQGGAPHVEAMRAMGFNNIATDWANLVSRITSNPKAANQPEVINKLREMVAGIKTVDNKIIRDNLDAARVTYAPLFQGDPQRWANYEAAIMKTTTSPGEQQGGGEIRKQVQTQQGIKTGVWDANGKFVRYE